MGLDFRGDAPVFDRYSSTFCHKKHMCRELEKAELIFMGSALFSFKGRLKLRLERDFVV